MNHFWWTEGLTLIRQWCLTNKEDTNHDRDKGGNKHKGRLKALKIEPKTKIRNVQVEVTCKMRDLFIVLSITVSLYRLIYEKNIHLYE